MNPLTKFALAAWALALLLGGCVGGGPEVPTQTETTHNQGMDVYEAQMQAYDGPKVNVAIGDFQVKAAGATREIGDGLREMLMTSLFDSNHFIVLDRQAMKDMMLEQDLSASRRAERDTGPERGHIEGADLYLYGVVSEFEADSGGMGLSLFSGQLPLSAGAGSKNSHMAIDLRATDMKSGRVVFATRVEGKTTDYNANVGTTLGRGEGALPVSLGKYTNTPMEKAIRACIDQAVKQLIVKTPKQYYKH